ncbi:MAG TPA: allantoinase AllB, partial [Rubrobacteraceae bacterium]|nr:allantoinase AllB [Rubrobacteraceae bacterium]
GISDGVVAAVEPELEGSAGMEIDASGLHVFPGLIDAHVHFNEPGRTHWEGFETGSRAFAAGGATTVFDMPLNAYPPTVDGKSFDLKLAAAEKSALVDFALWGAIQPDNLGGMEELAGRGVVGFKAFMSASGTEDFKNVDDLELYEGMVQAERLGLLVGVHAESQPITSRLTQRALAGVRVSARDYLDSRPVIAELEAISRAILFAEDTGCALHIVHVSTGRGVDLVNDARERGVDVTCETCAHYLMLTEDDLEELGAVAKCAPPLRTAEEREALWERILDGRIPMVTSDHSPCPPEMKSGNDMFRAWGGISGGQSTMQVLLTGGEERGVLLPTLASVTSEAVAGRFGLSKKGRIEAGYDADLTLVDLDHSGTFKAEDLLYRHKQSPYVGRELKGKVVHTLLRGNPVFSEGRVVSEPKGRLVRPDVPA